MEEIKAATSLGRPRGFDVDQAIEAAMRQFWEHGYEGTSLTDLTEAMGMPRSTMYAVLGNKETVFRRALERYAEGKGAYAERALREPTARAVATAYLFGSIDATTALRDPAGCLGVQGSLVASRTNQFVSELLAVWRESAFPHLCERFQRAIEEGDLPADAEPDVLSRYLMTLSNGIAVQAAGGTGRDELRRVATLALAAWPTR